MTTPVTGHIVVCNTCHARTVILDDDVNVHDALQCACCPEKHNHGEASNATGVPCRPVTVYANAVAALLPFVTGGN